MPQAAADSENWTLTTTAASVTIDTMKSMTEVIRQAVLDSGLPLQQIAEAAGIERASLSRFVREERTLRLDMADKLADYFGLELKRTTETRKHKRKKK